MPPATAVHAAAACSTFVPKPPDYSTTATQHDNGALHHSIQVNAVSIVMMVGGDLNCELASGGACA
jgi:hypothetical protein